MDRKVNVRLKAAIIESGKSFSEVAESINMPMTTFSRKINGHAAFNEEEMESICKLLGKEPNAIFFAKLVTNRITANTA